MTDGCFVCASAHALTVKLSRAQLGTAVITLLCSFACTMCASPQAWVGCDLRLWIAADLSATLVLLQHYTMHKQGSTIQCTADVTLAPYCGAQADLSLCRSHSMADTGTACMHSCNCVTPRSQPPFPSSLRPTKQATAGPKPTLAKPPRQLCEIATQMTTPEHKPANPE